MVQLNLQDYQHLTRIKGCQKTAPVIFHHKKSNKLFCCCKCSLPKFTIQHKQTISFSLTLNQAQAVENFSNISFFFNLFINEPLQEALGGMVAFLVSDINNIIYQ